MNRFKLRMKSAKLQTQKDSNFSKRCLMVGTLLTHWKKTEIEVRNKLNATKFQTYCTELNPNLEVHEVYRKSDYVPDYLRVYFTRLRLMSHNLKIETGRWSRLQREDRVCQCDRVNVQDEKHVLLDCPMTAQIRQRYQLLQFESINSLLKCNNIFVLCKFVKEILDTFA